MSTPPTVSPRLAAQADAAFQAVTRDAGLPPDGWEVTPLAVREVFRNTRAVFRVRHPDHDALIFRHVSEPWQPEVFAEIYRWQATVHARFPHDARLTTPGTVALVAGSQASLTTCLPGDTLQDRLSWTDDREAHRADLHRAGAWTAAFHAAGDARMEVFSAVAVLERWHRIGAEVREGRRLVAEPELFAHGLAWFESRAGALDGLPMMHAVRHGDLNLRNLLVDGGRMAGIDFDPPARGPVGLDLSALLVNHAMELDAVRGQVPPGSAFPSWAEGALRDGYGPKAPPPEVLRVLAADEVLDVFLRIPGRPEQRKSSRRRLLRWLLPIARSLFGAT
jgi:hypothetical protein